MSEDPQETENDTQFDTQFDTQSETYSGPQQEFDSNTTDSSTTDSNKDKSSSSNSKSTDESNLKRETESMRMIRDHTIWAMGAGLFPIPLLDIASVTAIQTDLIRKLSALYDQPYEKHQSKAMISALAGSTGARLAADGLKLIPGVGTLVGGLIMSGLSGASTYALGKVFIKHFEGGGTLLDFDPLRWRDYFKQQVNTGKTYSEKLRKVRPAAKDPQQILFQQLRDLAELRDSGILSEDEFSRAKAQLIEAATSRKA